MVTERKPADYPDLSYKFSEQMDPKTGFAVGLVPLEIVRKKGYLAQLPFGSTYHDIGGGLGTSARHVLSMVPDDVRRSLRVVVSEPYNDIPTHARRAIAEQVGGLVVLRNDAVASAGVVKADLTSLINMVHLLEEGERTVLWKKLFDSSPDGSLQIVITTFIENWIPEDRKDQVSGFMEMWMMRIARDARDKLSDEEFAEFRRRKKAEKLPLLNVEELVAEMTSAGFEILHQSIETMPCTVESYDLIRYDQEWLGFITPGIKPKIACQIQGDALQRVIDSKGLDFETEMPRNTLVLVARKAVRADVLDQSKGQVANSRNRELVAA